MSFKGSNFFKIVQSGSDFLDVFFQENAMWYLNWEAGSHYSGFCRADPLGHSRVGTAPEKAGCCLGENSVFLAFASQWQYYCLKSYDVSCTIGCRSVDDVDGGNVGGVSDDSRIYLIARMRRTHLYQDRDNANAESLVSDPGSVVDRCVASDDYPRARLSVYPTTFEERNRSWLKCLFYSGGSQVDFSAGLHVPFCPCFDFVCYSEKSPFSTWSYNRAAQWQLTIRTLVRFRGSRSICDFIVPESEPNSSVSAGEVKSPDPVEGDTEDGGPGAEPPENFLRFKNEDGVKH